MQIRPKSPSQKRAMKAQPERTCIACRKKGEKGELLRMAASPAGVIIIDYTEKVPGRGAYICPEKECIEKLLKTGAGGALSRALKQHVEPPLREAFYKELTDKVRKKASALLGMARKAGLAVYGFDAALGEAYKTPGGVMVISEDLAENSRKRLFERMNGDNSLVFNFSDKEALGAIIGSSPVGIIYVKPSDLSRSLARELSRFLNVSRG
jgi:predicted RNA-binding protein YlxR (DUF448 family)